MLPLEGKLSAEPTDEVGICHNQEYKKTGRSAGLLYLILFPTSSMNAPKAFGTA